MEINWWITKTAMPEGRRKIGEFGESLWGKALVWYCSIVVIPSSASRLPSNYIRAPEQKFNSITPPHWAQAWHCLTLNVVNDIVRQINWRRWYFLTYTTFWIRQQWWFCLALQQKYFNKPAMFVTNYYHWCYNFGLQM